MLANEEVINGLSERGNHPVQRLPLRQWLLKITAYADRLEAGLDGLDWPSGTLTAQQQWIGKSEGCRIDFPLEAGIDKDKVGIHGLLRVRYCLGYRRFDVASFVFSQNRKLPSSPRVQILSWVSPT